MTSLFTDVTSEALWQYVPLHITITYFNSSTVSSFLLW